ncbi:hypothetical protein HHK36_009953 [Tetracentron sinense]|uniref:Uncharacterized protein n=1 Tax=Tetracentron sinense TaxID=13715 RepID=A0A834ZE44_TETSI|nr:hypothetical protein HHK36_009953 [Tetracentron sinense]
MSVFAHEEPKPPSKPCKFLPSALKEAFAHCQACRGQMSSPIPEVEYSASDNDDEQEVVVLAIRNRAMEAKLRRKARLMTDSFCWVLCPTTRDLFIPPKGVQNLEYDEDEEDEESQAFFSAGSCFSRCSSTSREVLFSVGSCFSRCSSMNGIDFGDLRKKSIIQEFCHCEGWPFGLCRKAMLLPPLPRSPSESWKWRKGTPMVKMA